MNPARRTALACWRRRRRPVRAGYAGCDAVLILVRGGGLARVCSSRCATAYPCRAAAEALADARSSLTAASSTPARTCSVMGVDSTPSSTPPHLAAAGFLSAAWGSLASPASAAAAATLRLSLVLRRARIFVCRGAPQLRSLPVADLVVGGRCVHPRVRSAWFHSLVVLVLGESLARLAAGAGGDGVLGRHASPWRRR